MVKLFIVDDHEVVRLGLMPFATSCNQNLKVGEASSQEEAIKKALKVKPDVILMDVKLSMEASVSKDSGIMVQPAYKRNNYTKLMLLC
ncbi:response regulator transcription factor [Anaerobacillus sp. HL2]|nr:response regulator transcription factor [Anaerobacillus sp. HL2]